MDVPNVLLADDDMRALRPLALALQRAGMNVRMVPNGMEAKRVLEQEPTDVLVADIRMPGNESLELVRSQIVRASDVAVIVMTGNATVETAVAAMKLDACDYLTKPFRVADLIASVRRGFEKRKRLLLERQLVSAATSLATASESTEQPSATSESGLSVDVRRQLSEREAEVAALVARGIKVDQVARNLSISPHTVRNHLRSIYRKLDVNSQNELLVKLLKD